MVPVGSWVQKNLMLFFSNVVNSNSSLSITVKNELYTHIHLN